MVIKGEINGNYVWPAMSAQCTRSIGQIVKSVGQCVLRVSVSQWVTLHDCQWIKRVESSIGQQSFTGLYQTGHQGEILGDVVTHCFFVRHTGNGIIFQHCSYKKNCFRIRLSVISKMARYDVGLNWAISAMTFDLGGLKPYYIYSTTVDLVSMLGWTDASLELFSPVIYASWL